MHRSRSHYCILCWILGLALAWLYVFAAPSAVHAQKKDPKAAKKDGPVSFIADVAPILKERCFSCHDSKNKKGKFDMSTYDAFRYGGTKADPVVPGKSNASVLMFVLTDKGPGRMPPKEVGSALPKEQLDLIARWIDQGAKLDAGIDAKASLVKELRVRWTPPAPPVAYQFPMMINALAFTPDSKQIVVGGYHELTVWDVATGNLVRRVFTRAERAYAMDFLPDGNLVVAGGRPGQEGDVRIYNIKAGKATKHGSVEAVDGVNDKSVLVKVLGSSDDSIMGLGVSPDGKKVAAAGCDRIVRVWDVASGKEEYALEYHADWVFDVAFSPDGKKLVSGSRDKTAKVWDLVAKESLLTFPGHKESVYGVAFTPDGKTGVSAGEDRNIRTWQATDDAKQIGKQIRALGTHGDIILRMDQYLDGKDPKKALLATASADRTVKLWDPINNKALQTLSGFNDWVYSVAISPNGQLVAGGTWNGEVRVFNVSDGKLVKDFNASPGYVAKTTKK